MLLVLVGPALAQTSQVTSPGATQPPLSGPAAQTTSIYGGAVATPVPSVSAESGEASAPAPVAKALGTAVILNGVIP
jgi:hypothetical protein